MKLLCLLPILLTRSSRGEESIKSVLSTPQGYRNESISKQECSVNIDDIQCSAEGAIAKEYPTQYPTENIYTDEDFGVRQQIDSANYDEQIKFMNAWISYMVSHVMNNPEFASVKKTCKNKHESCSFWASIGECEKNPGYMKINCAPACASCEQLDFNRRCPVDKNAKNAFESGDVNRFFERLLSEEEFEKYNITVHSRPKREDDEEDFLDGPWLITLEDFISEEEAKRLIELGGEEGYERSTDVGVILNDGSYTKKVDSFRTSSNSWCLDSCMEDPVAQDVVNRIEHLTKIPTVNSESLQLLRYEEGQYYAVHHDLITHQKDRPPGVRILTFYIYLNGNEDSGLEGGGTKFPRVGKNGITVTPKRGRVAMWSSVLNDNPHQKDPRTDHTALPVKKGVKYGANAWIHQRDFMTPNKVGCT